MVWLVVMNELALVPKVCYLQVKDISLQKGKICGNLPILMPV